jgi:hypothetical protein
LQKATGRDRKWLQDFGWRVKEIRVLEPSDEVKAEPPAPVQVVERFASVNQPARPWWKRLLGLA